MDRLEVPVSDGNYHTVTLIKEGRKIRIQLDDEHESMPRRLVKYKIIESPSRGGLFIGGTRKFKIFSGCF